MKDVSLRELMRFGLAGGVYLGALVIGFIEPRELICGQDSGLIVGGAAAVALVIGSILYSVHRAILFPVVRRVFLGLADKEMSALEFDLKRWSLSLELDTQSLQSRLGVWADQIHFLYCASWASFLALPTGWLFEWGKSAQAWAIVIVAFFFLFVAVHYNRRYKEYEYVIIDEDTRRVAQLTSASSRRDKR